MEDPFILRLVAATAFVGSTLFIGLFSLDPWFKREFGRSIMAMSVGVWIFSLLVLIKPWTGADFGARQWLRGTSYTLITYAVWSRFFVLLAERLRERRDARGRRR